MRKFIPEVMTEMIYSITHMGDCTEPGGNPSSSLLKEMRGQMPVEQGFKTPVQASAKSE